MSNFTGSVGALGQNFVVSDSWPTSTANTCWSKNFVLTEAEYSTEADEWMFLCTEIPGGPSWTQNYYWEAGEAALAQRL